MPRILELLDSVGLRATFFVVARDAQGEGPLLREIIHRGHEIASHSLTHPVPFATLPPDRVWQELVESRERLEQTVGERVRGFRAPSWDVSHETLEAIARAGYQYDASVLPSPALLAGAAARLILSRGRLRLVSLSYPARMAVSRRLPYRLNGSGLLEFPIAVSPILRIPFTHTLHYVAPAGLRRRTYRAIRRSDATLSYEFHAVDALDLKRDGLDARMARHPGMQLPLDHKLALLVGSFREIAESYQVVTYAEAISRSGTISY